MSLSLPLANISSPWAWGIILLLALLFFGRRLPGVARNLGQGINEFKKGLNDGTKIERTDDEPSTPPSNASADRQPTKTEIDKTSV